MLNNVDLQEVDVSGLFLNDDFTNSTASLSMSDDSSVESSVPDFDTDITNSSTDFETVETGSTSTGNASNIHNCPYADTVDDTVPTDIECHNLEDGYFDVYYQVPVPKN